MGWKIPCRDPGRDVRNSLDSSADRDDEHDLAALTSPPIVSLLQLQQF